MTSEKFAEIGEYAAAGAFENENDSLFCRKARGIRRYYETCELYEYDRASSLYPSGAKRERMIIRPHYLNGFEIDYSRITAENAELFRRFEEVFFAYRSKVPPEHTVAGNMYCHSIPNYGRIAAEGFDSYAKRVAGITDPDLKSGLTDIYEGIKCYLHRCVEYLEETGADGKLINALKKVPLGRADNVYEAIVSRNFVMYLDNCDNLGCLAKDLSELYRGENIIPILSDLYDNLDINNGYSMSLDSENISLTCQCLAAARGKRRPMIELFVDENKPHEIWNAAFELMRSGGGQPAFYNPHILLGGLKKALNVPDDDLKCFCGGGCTESMFAGMSNVGSIDAGINLLLIFERVMHDALPTSSCFEDFYAEYIADVGRVIEDVTKRISASQKERAKLDPLPMRTFLIDDCIDAEKEYNNGGARYNASVINFAGIVNVIDSMLAIKELIFEERTETVDDFLQKLKNGDEALLSKCRGAKKCHGRDDEECNAFSRRFSSDLFSMLDGRTPYLGGRFLPASIQFMSQVDAGRMIGATPDGRRAGAPLADSLGAIFGKDEVGATALLKSVTSLELDKALGVPVLNFNIDESMSDDILRALILSYMRLGGVQMQITRLSADMLREAYEDPDMHKNLIVRVGGYSEYFCRLSPELRKMILDRSIQKP